MSYEAAENPYAPVSLPPTAKQMNYARQLAMQTGTPLPWEAQQGRRRLSRWIDMQKQVLLNSEAFQRPSSRQVAFAERLARMKRTRVPDECFQDRKSMSRWIDQHKS